MSRARSRPSCRARRPGRRPPLRVEPLESRQLLTLAACGPPSDLLDDLDGYPHAGLCHCPLCSGLVLDQLQAEVGESIGLGGAQHAGIALAPLSALPQLSSLPGSQYTLHLDFDGHVTGQWGSWSNVSTPAFDQDGDPTTFSAGELAAIEEVWRRVAEDFAPFNINVTTVDPGNLTNGRTLKVAIGGAWSDWFGSSAGGVAYVGAFTNSAPNVVFVFAKNLAGGVARYVAEAASHEAGHGFGLWHQSTYNGATKVDEYNSGNGAWAPIMGGGYYSQVTTWHNGANNLGASSYQDDMAILANSTNGFGYRPDDHGNTLATSTILAFSGSAASSAGIIGQTSDVDWFRFTTSGGSVQINVAVASVGANLDSVLQLVDGYGQVMATAAPTNSLNSSLSLQLAAGTYFAVVSGNGSYGSVGQFTIHVEAPQLPPGNNEPGNDNSGGDDSSNNNNGGGGPSDPPAAPPQFALHLGRTTLHSGQSVLDFGSTFQGTSQLRTLTIRNTSGGTLRLDRIDAASLPEGFSLVSNIARTTLNRNQTTTFRIQLTGALEGQYGGTLAIVSDQGTFQLQVAGRVTPPPVHQIVDDGDERFSLGGGAWSVVPRGRDGDTHVSNRDVPGAAAHWQFEGLAPGRYQVFATWTANPQASNRATYKIADGDTTLRQTAVNQRSAIRGVNFAGTRWQSLGFVDVTSDSIQVTLQATGRVSLVADAVRILQVTSFAPSGAPTMEGMSPVNSYHPAGEFVLRGTSVANGALEQDQVAISALKATNSEETGSAGSMNEGEDAALSVTTIEVDAGQGSISSLNGSQPTPLSSLSTMETQSADRNESGSFDLLTPAAVDAFFAASSCGSLLS